MARPATTRVGAELVPVSHRVTMEDMILFEPEGGRNIHTDDEVARWAGLPAAIAAGVQFMSYIFEMLYGEYGFDAVPGTVLDVRIRTPVFAGDTVTARGRVTDADPQEGRQRLHLVVWCENQREEQVIAGISQVTVPAGV
jgi:3-hydroxybutyryl-CoA dehydratase